jgi:hypothetical protein
MHALLLGLIAAELLAGIPLSPLVAERYANEQIELTAVAEPAPPLATVAGLFDERPTADEITADEIARQTAAVTPTLARELLDPAATTAAAAHWVQQRMLDEIAAADRLSVSENQERLAQLGQQLEQISSPESVDAVSSKLNTLLGTSGRATQPAAEPVAGEFDHDTAQLYDVKRSENAGGGYDYVAVLLDAAGRTMESTLTQAEGEQLYKTFELMKANPLLERIYRGVVMSLLDKLLRPNQAAAPGARPAP